MKHLKNLGLGKEVMSKLITKELSNLLKILPNNNAPLKNLLAPFVINIIWNLVSGSTFAVGDPRIEKLMKILADRSKVFDLAGGVLNVFPWLRYIIPKKIGFDILCKLNKELYLMFMETISEHYKLHNEEYDEDFIDVYISEMKNGNSSFTGNFDE